MLPLDFRHLGPIDSWWPWLQPIMGKGVINSLPISELQRNVPSAYMIGRTKKKTRHTKRHNIKKTHFQRSFNGSFLLCESLSLYAYYFLIATPTQGVASFLFCIRARLSQSYSAELDLGRILECLDETRVSTSFI